MSSSLKNLIHSDTSIICLLSHLQLTCAVFFCTEACNVTGKTFVHWQIVNSSKAVDIVLVVDMSFSMGKLVQALPGFVRTLEESLVRRGIGSTNGTLVNNYALVAFGGKPGIPPQIYTSTANNSRTLYPITEFPFAALSQPKAKPGTHEDGYEAIKYAMENVPLRVSNNVARNIILITDEDRDVLPSSQLTRRSMKHSLKHIPVKALLHVIVDQDIRRDVDQLKLLGMDYNRIAYTTENGSHKMGAHLRLGYRLTRKQYSRLALEVRGSVWDIYRLLGQYPKVGEGIFAEAIAKVNWQVQPPTKEVCEVCTCMLDGEKRCGPSGNRATNSTCA